MQEYREFAPKYRSAGWRGILPLPAAAKGPPPKGFTGADGDWPSWPDIQTWIDTKPLDSNIAIRLPRTVIGLDIDAYGTKQGAQTLEEAEKRWGPLPPTWRSTSRLDDPVSGIRLYRIPEDAVLQPDAGPGIEIIQYRHRYAVVWPSIHPEGRQYRWIAPNSEVFEGIPRPNDLPQFPPAWLEGLATQQIAITDGVDVDVAKVLAELPDGDMDSAVSQKVSAAISDLQTGSVGSRHDTALRAALALFRLAEQGHTGVKLALTALRIVFVTTVVRDGSRTEPEAAAEWARMITNQRGHALIAATPTVDLHQLAGLPPGNGHKVAAAEPITLAHAHAVFRKWLGVTYDLQALDAVLAAAAAEQLGGDPLWLLVISGPGNAKTETVQALAGAGGVIVSTISSAGALLSASPAKQRAKDATGGLLRKIGPRGVLVIKDVTSILSMPRETRGEVLAALREIYDGKWIRNVGSDGGRTLEWTGRIAVVGAVTTAWDTAHGVVAAMGDRFVLLRMDSRSMRVQAGRQAMANTGGEDAMRAELAEAVSGVLVAADPSKAVALDHEETETLLGAANLVTLARTAVEFDYRGEVIDAHAPEMPTRFAKQLVQVVRGACALGLGRRDAMALALRCARDSMPPLRLEILEYLATHPHSSTSEVRRAIGKPHTTVGRQLDALHALGLLTCDEMEWGANGKTRWFYTLAPDADPGVLAPVSSPVLSVDECRGEKNRAA